MSIMKYLGYLVIGIYVGGIIWLALLPDEYVVQRSVVISAPKDVVFDLVADLQQWDHWSPWEELDINAMKKYEGTPKKVGYKYFWQGNEEIGEGSIQIAEVIEHEHLAFKVVFKEPFESKSNNTWTFSDANGATKVTWEDRGRLPFFLRGLSGILETRIGASFEYGLTNIKAMAEDTHLKRLELSKAAE